jgi:hypothetical protein
MSIDIDHPNEKLIPNSGDLTIDGNQIISGLTANQAVQTDSSKRLISVAVLSTIDLLAFAADQG